MGKEKIVITRQEKAQIWLDRSEISLEANYGLTRRPSAYPEIITKTIFSKPNLFQYATKTIGVEIMEIVIRAIYSPMIKEIRLTDGCIVLVKSDDVRWEDVFPLIRNCCWEFKLEALNFADSITYKFSSEVDDLSNRVTGYHISDRRGDNLPESLDLLLLSKKISEIWIMSGSHIALLPKDGVSIEELDAQVLLAFRRHFLAEDTEVELVVEGAKMDNTKLR